MLREQRNDILYILYESEYILEDGHSKKVKARHNEKKKNIEKRFYDNMNYKHSHTDEKGNKHGTVKRGDGPEVPITIHKKGRDAYCSYDTGIHMGRSVTRMKGSDMAGSHEYAHGIDDDKIRKKGTFDSEREKIENSKTSQRKKNKKIGKLYDKEIEKINEEDGFDKLTKSANKKNKIKNNHDKQPEEIRADYYSNTTTKGENNTNRDRKFLNELSRRNNQYANSENNRIIHKNEKDVNDSQKKMKKLKDDVDRSNASPLKKATAKSILRAGRFVAKAGEKSIKKKNDKIRKRDEDVKQINKRDNETRKKTNDYIMKKKKEEEKNKEK